MGRCRDMFRAKLNQKCANEKATPGEQTTLLPVINKSKANMLLAGSAAEESLHPAEGQSSQGSGYLSDSTKGRKGAVRFSGDSGDDAGGPSIPKKRRINQSRRGGINSKQGDVFPTRRSKYSNVVP